MRWGDGSVQTVIMASKLWSYNFLDHLVDDLDRLETFDVLVASHYEHLNSVVKKSYASSSKRLQTRTADTVRNLDTSFWRQNVSTICDHAKTKTTSSRRPGLVRPGETLLFKALLYSRRKHDYGWYLTRAGLILTDYLPAKLPYNGHETDCYSLHCSPAIRLVRLCTWWFCTNNVRFQRAGKRINGHR